MQSSRSPACPGWLMTAVASWGENAEDAFDQGLVELGLGDVRLIQAQGAMLPLGSVSYTHLTLPTIYSV